MNRMAYDVIRSYLTQDLKYDIMNETSVGYQKITKDEASDADLANAEVAFQPHTQTACPLSNAKVAFQSQARRSPDADLASFVRRGGRQTRTSRPLSDAEVVRRRDRVSTQTRA